MTIMELKGNLIQSGWSENEVLIAISELSKNTNFTKTDIKLPEDNLVEGVENKMDILREASISKEMTKKDEKKELPNKRDNLTKVEPKKSKETEIEEEKIKDDNNQDSKKDNKKEMHHNPLPVQEDIIDKSLSQNKKSFLSRKNMIIIGSSILVVILIVVIILMFSSGKESSLENVKTVNVLNGTIVEFTKDSMNIKIKERTIPFIINRVDEYIIHYTFGEISGELFMKEEIKVDLDGDGEDDIILNLEKINEGIPSVLIKGI